VNRREKLAQSLDRAVLGTMMLGLAFVMEKALDRMVDPKPGEKRPPSRLGKAIFRRVLPGLSAHVQHQHTTRHE
jgi:hypothetical protein